MNIAELESIMPKGWRVKVFGWYGLTFTGPNSMAISVDVEYDYMIGYFKNSDGQSIRVTNLCDYDDKDSTCALKAIESLEKTYEEYFSFEWPPAYIRRGW